MLSWSINKSRIALGLAMGFLSGFLMLQALPLADRNALFLAALPLAFALMLMMVLDLRWVLALTILSRALLDPVFDATKIEGAGFGAGALMNLMIVGLAALVLMGDGRRWFKERVSRYWIAYLTICAVAILYTPVTMQGLKVLINLLSYAGMLALPFYLIRDERDHRFWLKVLVFSTLLPALFADVHWLRGGTFYADAGMRVHGTFSHPNILAFFLVFAAAITVMALRSGDLRLGGWTRTLLRVHLVNIFALLIATKTRNAWLALWIFFFVFGALKDKKILFVTLVLPPLAMLHPAVWDRVQDLFQGHGENLESGLNSGAWRMLLWQRGLEYLGANFLTGRGLASFQPLSTHFFQTPEAGAPAHNVYLEMLFETGVLGLCAFVAIFASILRFFWIRRRSMWPERSMQCAALVAYIFSYAFSSAGDNMLAYLAFNWYFWFFVGVMMRGERVRDDAGIGHYSFV